MTKTNAMDAARAARHVHAGTWYVTRKGNYFLAIKSKLYSQKEHGLVVAIFGTA